MANFLSISPDQTKFFPSVCLVPAGLFCYFGFSLCGILGMFQYCFNIPQLSINYKSIYLFFTTFLICLTIFHFTVYQFSLPSFSNSSNPREAITRDWVTYATTSYVPQRIKKNKLYNSNETRWDHYTYV